MTIAIAIVDVDAIRINSIIIKCHIIRSSQRLPDLPGSLH